MALKVDKLMAFGVTRLRKPGCHNDGAGLYLQVSPSGSKSWVFRYKRAKRSREMGLGSINTFRLIGLSASQVGGRLHRRP